MNILLGILIFKGLTALRIYKSFDVKGLKTNHTSLQAIIFLNKKIILPYKPIILSYKPIILSHKSIIHP
jgi:hypothetical protein